MAAGSTTNLSLRTADGRDRSYTLYVPKDYSAVATPLLVAFHGWTSSGSSMQRGSGLDKTADRYNVIAAFPNGVSDFDAGRGWAFPGCNASPNTQAGADEFGRRAVCERGDEYKCSQSCPTTAEDATQWTTAANQWKSSGLKFSGAVPPGPLSPGETLCEVTIALATATGVRAWTTRRLYASWCPTLPRAPVSTSIASTPPA